MPLDEYSAEDLDLLKTQPEAAEIQRERVKFLRNTAENGRFDAVFNIHNRTAQ
jgi:uncharacterized oxidoreductase